MHAYPHRTRTAPIVHGIKELLWMQSNGKFLTPDEKQKVRKEAEEIRRKRLNKK